MNTRCTAHYCRLNTFCVLFAHTLSAVAARFARLTCEGAAGLSVNMPWQEFKSDLQSAVASVDFEGISHITAGDDADFTFRFTPEGRGIFYTISVVLSGKI